jgi:alkaline phosphatase D
MTQFNRRTLLSLAAMAGLAPTASALAAKGLSAGVFTHGLASGDPLPDRVILWTRFVTPDGQGGRIGWEVAKDEAFTRIVAKGVAIASPFNDYCAKVDARGLQPNGRYFYRFISASGMSPIGRTRTAPAAGHDPLTIALFSCSNLPFGHFNAYAHAAMREDIDLCVHVGDYVYEYPRGTYPSFDQALRGRWIEPAGEMIHLSDYYQRYASYRADPDLQEVHRQKPFAVVWDDHELANNAWWEGAQNHQPQSEGNWVDRRAAAFKAYVDWMPIRVFANEPLRIYRRLDWGQTASILMLDTRLIGRDAQLDWQEVMAPALAQGEGAVIKAVADLAGGKLIDPKRSLLGARQETWLESELKRAKARGTDWAVLAQQVIFGQQFGSSEAARLLAPDAPAGRKQFINLTGELAKRGLEWNLDSWGGYPAARGRAIAAMEQFGPNVSILAGDSHNTWLNDIAGAKGLAGVEFAGGSVSSPGFETTLSQAAEGEREAVIRAANPLLKWADVTNRGYGVLRYSPKALEAQWVASASITSRNPLAKSITKLVAETGASGLSGWMLA